MNEAVLAARIVEALAASAEGAPLVSVELSVLAPGEAVRVETRIERRTRTLVFQSADAFDANGARIASATSVHRIAD